MVVLIEGQHSYLVLLRANTDRFGFAVFCRANGTSYHLTFGKCLINQNSLLEHCNFYFEMALTSTAEENIKMRAIAKTLTSTSV